VAKPADRVGGEDEMKKSILFVDDDKKEVVRFREVMGARYAIGAGVTLEDALAELRDSGGVTKPDLVLLDLYYGPETREEMREEIEKADDELSLAEEKVRRVLEKARQSPDGGLELAEQVHAQIPTSARAFFSRKAFLKDALNAYKKELPLVEKPDPNEGDKTTGDPYKSAMRRHFGELSRQFDGIIYKNTFWAKHREVINGALVGFLVSLVWDVVKDPYHTGWLASLPFLSGAVALAIVIWVAKRL
jgi:hypothetical protein